MSTVTPLLPLNLTDALSAPSASIAVLPTKWTEAISLTVAGTFLLYLFLTKDMYLANWNRRTAVAYFLGGLVVAASYLVPSNPMSVALDAALQFVQDQKPVIVVPSFLALFVVTHLPRVRSTESLEPMERDTLQAKYKHTDELTACERPPVKLSSQTTPAPLITEHMSSTGVPKTASGPGALVEPLSTPLRSQEVLSQASIPKASSMGGDEVRLRVHNVPRPQGESTKYETVRLQPPRKEERGMDVYNLSA